MKIIDLLLSALQLVAGMQGATAANLEIATQLPLLKSLLPDLTASGAWMR